MLKYTVPECPIFFFNDALMPSYYFYVKFTHFFVNHNNDNDDDNDDDDTLHLTLKVQRQILIFNAASRTSAVAALINTLYDGPLASSTSSSALTITNN